MASSRKKVWTYDDLPTLVDDGRRFEIIDGVLVVSPAPSWWHQEVLKRIFVALFRQLEERGLAVVFFAPLDVILSPTKVFAPDVLVIRTERKAILENRGAVAAPDLAVEVLSPSNIKHDRLTKRRFYARNGVPEYWIVDPKAETIEVLALIDGGLSYRQVGLYGVGDRAESVTFPVELDVDAVFRRS